MLCFYKFHGSYHTITNTKVWRSRILYHIASINDNEIYFYVVGGGNKKENVYGLGVFSKRFTSSKSVDSTTNQPFLVHQTEVLVPAGYCDDLMKPTK